MTTGGSAGSRPGAAREDVADGVDAQLERRLRGTSARRARGPARSALGEREAAHAALRRGADVRQLHERGPEPLGRRCSAWTSSSSRTAARAGRRCPRRARVGEADHAVDLQLPLRRQRFDQNSVRSLTFPPPSTICGR